MTVSIHKNKNIGQVIYIVEGLRKEFTLLHHIFTKIFDYDFIEAKSQSDIKHTYRSKNNRNSTVCVIKSQSSNLSSIQLFSEYLDNIYQMLIEEYDIDVDNAAVFYIFDRDPYSNKNPGVIMELINRFTSSRDTNSDYVGNGLLLLSYPALESYVISCFKGDFNLIFNQSNEMKKYLEDNKFNQDRINETNIIYACENMYKVMKNEFGFELEENDLDNFQEANSHIFGIEERCFKQNECFILLSLLSISFLDLGLLRIDEN